MKNVSSDEYLSKKVKEQMMIRLYEIDENYENLKTKMVSYTTNKTMQTRGGQRDACTDGGRS